jgi:hypothetical protein
MTLAEMLEANSIPEPNSGCLIWLRACTRKGYPVVRRDGRNQYVSHLALEAKGIEVPKGFMACHRCDNTFCINDGHLFVGSAKDNTQDALKKGRLTLQRKKEFCIRGHPMSGDNLYIYAAHGRRCRACVRERKAKGRHAQS